MPPQRDRLRTKDHKVPHKAEECWVWGMQWGALGSGSLLCSGLAALHMSVAALSRAEPGFPDGGVTAETSKESRLLEVRSFKAKGARGDNPTRREHVWQRRVGRNRPISLSPQY